MGMQSKATTVQQYLSELPPDRREAIEAVRKVILKNLDKGFQECTQYGMIGYSVPHSLYPAGYHCDPKQPLPFAGLASQKNYMSVYLMTVYGDGTSDEKWFRDAWEMTGKKLDMGKCCIRFKKLEDAALDVIGMAIKRVPLKGFIELYERALADMGKHLLVRKSAKKAGAGTAKKNGAGAKASRSTAKSAAKKTAGTIKGAGKPARSARASKSARSRA
jgi:hypothetical protein